MGVGAAVGVGVGVGDGVGVGVGELVAVGARVGDAVAVGLSVGEVVGVDDGVVGENGSAAPVQPARRTRSASSKLVARPPPLTIAENTSNILPYYHCKGLTKNLLLIVTRLKVMAQGRMSVSDEDILGVFRDSEEPIMTAREIADQFSMTRQWAHHRLQKLHDDGVIEKKKSGERTVVWWLSD